MFKLRPRLTLLLLLLSACVPRAEPEPTQKSQIVIAEPVTAPSTTPITDPTESPTSTPTVPPTASATVTNVAPTTTTMPTMTPSPSATPGPRILDEFTSPDGQWQVILEGDNVYHDTATYTFRLIHADGEPAWIVEQFGHNPASLSGYDRRIPLHWSTDGQYLYYIHNGSGDGCGPELYGYDLYRLDLATGETVAIIREGNWFAIAPDEQHVAYLLDGAVIVHEIATGAETKAMLFIEPPLEFVNFTDLVWSPDSGALLVMGNEDICATGALRGGNYILRIDLPTFLQTVLIADPQLWRIVDWPEPGRAVVKTGEGDFWLNTETGEMTEIAG